MSTDAYDADGVPSAPVPAGDYVTVNVAEHAEAIAALKAWVEHEARGPGPLPPMYSNLLRSLGAEPVIDSRPRAPHRPIAFQDRQHITEKCAADGEL